MPNSDVINYNIAETRLEAGRRNPLLAREGSSAQLPQQGMPVHTFVDQVSLLKGESHCAGLHVTQRDPGGKRG